MAKKSKSAYSEFVIEAEELLESMGDRLTALEKDAEEGTVDPRDGERLLPLHAHPERTLGNVGAAGDLQAFPQP